MKIIYRLFVFVTVVVLLFGLFIVFMRKPRYEHKETKNFVESRKKESKATKINVFEEDKPLHILLLGIDKTKTTYENYDNFRSDTIMFLSIDPRKNQALLLSIPRDTYYKIDGFDNYKINAAYSRGGLELAIATIEKFMDTHIDHFVTVDYQAVSALVDAIGGVDVYTPEYKYTDPSTIPPLEIDFKEGMHHLDGKDAVKYLRIRKIYKNNDIDRIGVQQEFLLKIFEELKSPKLLLKIPKLLGIANNYVETDLNYGQLSYLAYYGLSLDKDDIKRETIQGEDFKRNGIDYWKVDIKAARQILKDFEAQEIDTSKMTEEELQKYREKEQKRQELDKESVKLYH